MERYQQDICKDCIYHKGEGHNMTCELRGEQPHYEHICHDFVANKRYIARYIASKNALKDELGNKGMVWLGIAGTLAIAYIIKYIVQDLLAYPVIFTILSILASAFGVYMFVHYRNKRREVDIELAKWLTKNDKLKLSSKEQSEEQPQEDTVTIDRALRLLKELGYAPECRRVSDGTTWIDFVYGETKMSLTITGPLVFIFCVYSWGDIPQTNEHIYRFMHAANQVMQHKRFVQITSGEEGYYFGISGYTPTMTVLREWLPTYMQCISESIIQHRQVFAAYMEDYERHTQQEKSNNQPVN